VGGTNPALLKALGYGNCVLALDVPFNAEVLQDAGLLWERDAGDLAAKIQRVIDDPDLAAELRERGRKRIQDAYRWDAVTADYERMFTRIIDGYYVAHRASD
jgi:glycosyltransferase involved in cell wall biosynthesis